MSTNKNKKNQTVDEVMTVAQLKPFFIECGIIPKFTDNSHYVGCGTRANVFSVNALKTKYNIYCNDTVFDGVNGTVDGCEYIANGNSNDKTRNNMIIATTTDQLKQLIKTVKTVLVGISIA